MCCGCWPAHSCSCRCKPAGEEYGFRGLILRVAGGWTHGARAVLGILVSGVAFAFVHLSTDSWLNVWYLVFAVSTALITWRTGGIEIAVVMHGAFNVLNFVFDTALRIDFDAVLADRTATAAMLLPTFAVMVAAAVIVWVLTRRSGPARTPLRMPSVEPARISTPL